jgi:hypothetical protein
MGLFGFGKTRGEIVDLTDMQKRGLLKTQIDDDEDENLMSGTLDLSSSSSTSSGSSMSSSSDSADSSGLSFLGNLAGASDSSTSSGTSSSASESAANYRERLRAARQGSVQTGSGLEVNHVKSKVEDMEYKMDRFIDKLDAIEERLKDLEGK